MATKASTHRLKPDVQAGLSLLSRVLRRPKNKLINEAVARYVQEKSLEMEKTTEATLRALRAYRKKDPNFEKALGKFAEAEAAHAGEDPIEGRIARPAGAVQSELRSVLHA